MKKEGDRIRLSASDIKKFTACPHVITLDLAYLRGEDLAPAEDSESAALLQKLGNQHEADYLGQLEAAGKTVTRIETDKLSFEESVAATQAALAAGPDIVYQGALAGGMWGGYSDFLERVPVPSELGSFSYEVSDTKLKRKPAPDHVLQLALYSDLLATVQGHTPEQAHVGLGSGERVSFRLVEYSSYARCVRERLETFIQTPPSTRPEKCPFCDLCRWREHCEKEWEETDSLFRVAGIRRTQIAKLEAVGIQTMQALADRKKKVPKLADETLEKLREQARLQHARKTGEPSYKLRPRVAGKGFDLLPKPNRADLFYDIEGDPHYVEAGSEGLEYLHGVWEGKNFTALWAHTHAEEKKLLEELFRLFEAHLGRSRGAHIYHYAPYEITALRRLAMRHGFGEAQLDGWLREQRFIDLYAVVRHGLFVSEPSYSLKKIEAFYDLSRAGEVETAGDSIVAYEKWCESHDDAILAEIEEYNRLDCVSLEKLRDWLLKIRPEGPWGSTGQESETATSVRQQDAQKELVRLLDRSVLPEERRRTLYDLGLYHWRENKPQAWAVFDAAGKDFEELCEDLECLAGLESIGVSGLGDRKYRYPPQETKLKAGKAAQVSIRGKFEKVNISQLDRVRHTICLAARLPMLPNRLDLLPDFALNPGSIPEAIRGVVEDQAQGRPGPATEGLLSRNPPRFKGSSPLPLDDDVDRVTGLIRAVRALDQSVLPVQGPPGTGKTYTASRAILALVDSGQRVAVTSNSHAAIRNVLMECARAKQDAGTRIVHKASGLSDFPEEYRERVVCVTGNQDPRLASARIVGGTAWLFSRPEHEKRFDCLFVDEAGQVSLANLLAMSNAAANLVLIGDPRQLPQIVQGSHPYPANLSCLDWIQGEEATINPERGIFLGETRRMHPDLCAYISEQFYESRLCSHPSTARQSVKAQGLPSSGAWRVPVVHEGRAQYSPEEVEAIRRTVDLLLAGTWTGKEESQRPFCERDIIVVAPYNAQVNALEEALPGIRVGTVDRFQGQEAPVALVSMTTSATEEIPRGMDFLLARERLNVAVSRGQGLSLAFVSPRLLYATCTTVGQVRLVNALCALPEAECL